jgi:hypothetical protein
MTAQLLKRPLSFEVADRGNLVLAWPERYWQPIAGTETLWHSRERTKSEKAELRARVRRSLAGPRRELLQRLIADLPDRPEVHPPIRRPKRPTPAPGRYALRLRAFELLLAGMPLQQVASVLAIRPAGVREMVHELRRETRPPRAIRPARIVSRPVETEAEQADPIEARIARLWHRGLRQSVIAERVGLSRIQWRERIAPRAVAGGPCIHCVAHSRHYGPDLPHYCRHHEVGFRLRAGRVAPTRLTAHHTVAEMRRLVPSSGLVLPAWQGSKRNRSAIGRLTRGLHANGCGHLAREFGDVMTKAAGKASFKQDYRNAWSGKA